MIYTHIAVALVAAVMGFGGAWQLQSLKAEAHEKQSIELAAEQERKLHAVEQAGRDAVIAAQNLARTREAQLRADAAGARRAVVGLQSATEAAVSDARASHEACVDRATALGVVLNLSAAEYRELAEKADRHVSDLRTLMDAR